MGPAPMTWGLVIQNDYNGGNNVTLTVNVTDSQGVQGQQNVTFKFGAF
jgi:hypothetical protein